jgi:MinD-like ATPase involved in chromosome partitioning or flagellar assembly
MTARAAASMIISTLLGGASGITHELTTSDTLLRSPLALSRRIGFVQLRGGSGASSTAGYVASMLACRRAGMVLAVNASAGEANLLWHAGLTRPAGGARNAHRIASRGSEEDGADEAFRSASDDEVGGSQARSAAREARNVLSRAHPRTAADARAGLPMTGTDLIALDLAHDHLATSAGTWFEQVTPIARFYDLVITDWGVRHRQVDLRQVARASHVVCLVTRADRYPAEEAAALIPALSEVEDQPRVVLALVDVGRTAERTPQLLCGQLQVPVLTIPYDPLRAAALPVGSRRLPTSTRLAYIRLCTALMAEALRPDNRRLVTLRPEANRPSPVAGGEQL